MKVLLVAPPYRPVEQSTLAIATLRPILEAHGHEVAELHGAPLYPNAGSVAAPALFHWNARFSFGHALRGGSIDDFLDQVLPAMVDELDRHGINRLKHGDDWARFGVDAARMRDDMRLKLAAAETCVERMVERARAAGPFDVVGFSAMFTDQVPAAIVLARRLRVLWPSVKVIFGGAVCFEEQASGLLATFPEVDAACHTDGEEVIAPLLDGLAGGRPMSAVPGIVYRDGAELHRTEPPAPIESLDALPLPVYDDFVAQLHASEWGHEQPHLFFETSRGCWWGQKKLCTFCGLNGEGIAFRAKSAARALAEIRTLHARHPTAWLRATDNILDFKYLKTVFPHLHDLARDPVRPLRLFYEIKSNIKAEQIEALVAGGVRDVQPGIESFSDGVLELMRKGCTALGQVQYVKWAAQAGLQSSYNLLVLNPGEDAAWYRDMLELFPFLEHLPPPQATVSMALERFSPYHEHPEAWGITNIRPSAYFRLAFGPSADVRLAYKFDFDHPVLDDPAHLEVVRAVAVAWRRWRDRWRPDMAYFVDDGSRLLVADRRGGTLHHAAIAGAAARLFVYLDQHRSRAQLAEAFPAIDAGVLDALLASWLHRRWICGVGERYLAVLPRRGPSRIRSAAQPRRAPVHLPLA